MQKVSPTKRQLMRCSLVYAGLWAFSALVSQAQGILTVTPGRTVATKGGTGVVGYSGDGGAAAAATLASPSAVTYDSNGNTFVADAQNHVVRMISSTGNITTVAGRGIAGFGGDGGTATAAYLDTPTGIAVDSSGNLYIADSHNHRIRRVSGGVITTIAGSGTPGFSGDGDSATAAQLSLPSAIAIDISGNLYIADTNNQRIRKVASGRITTVAGNGEQMYAGDGGAATSASLNAPTGVAVDSSGRIYIADRLNQCVRTVDAGGTITTLAGNGTSVSFAGGYSGDGTAATAAALAKPAGVSIDVSGNLYIADTNNQRIRQVSHGIISTVVGTGEQGFAGNGDPANDAILNAPLAATADSSGNLVVADKLNQRVRSGNLPHLAYVSQSVGVPSAPQTVTLANTGTAPIHVSSITLGGPFIASSGGSCSGTPIALAPGVSCTQNISFQPVASGPDNGSVSFSGAGIVPQSILLTGSSSQSTTQTSLATSASPSLAGQSVILTATVTAPGSPSGSVTFFDGTVALGTQPLTSGSASVTLSALAAGIHNITAVYSGGPSYTGSSSPAVQQAVQDFNLNVVPEPGNPGGSTNQTVIPGQTATFKFTLLPATGGFDYPITLSTAGLPPGASVVLTPQTTTPGTTASSFTVAIKTTPVSASGTHKTGNRANALFAIFLLPLIRPLRRKTQSLKLLTLCLAAFVSFSAITLLIGCGAGTGFFGQPQKSYTVTVTGEAAGLNGAVLQHSTAVTLTVQ